MRLAPFYDVASSLPYGWAEQKTRLAMKFGSGYNINPYSLPWERLAADLQLPEDLVRERARHLVDVAPDAFRVVAADQGVRDLGSSLPDRMVDLVAERATKCGRIL